MSSALLSSSPPLFPVREKEVKVRGKEYQKGKMTGRGVQKGGESKNERKKKNKNKKQDKRYEIRVKTKGCAESKKMIINKQTNKRTTVNKCARDLSSFPTKFAPKYWVAMDSK
jgi:hypothetical protein